MSIKGSGYKKDYYQNKIRSCEFQGPELQWNFDTTDQAVKETKIVQDNKSLSYFREEFY